MVDGNVDDKAIIHGLLDAFSQDRRLVTRRRYIDDVLNVGYCVLMQPPKDLQYLIAANDDVYLSVYSSLFDYFYTKYSAKLIIFRAFLFNLYQIQKRLKIPRKLITTAIFGAFLFVTPTYQITHSPT